MVAKWQKRRSSRTFPRSPSPPHNYPRNDRVTHVLGPDRRVMRVMLLKFSRVIPMPGSVTYTFKAKREERVEDPRGAVLESVADRELVQSGDPPEAFLSSADRHLPVCLFPSGPAIASGLPCQAAEQPRLPAEQLEQPPGTTRDAPLQNPVESILVARVKRPAWPARHTHSKTVSANEPFFAPHSRPHPPPIGSLVPLWS